MYYSCFFIFVIKSEQEFYPSHTYMLGSPYTIRSQTPIPWLCKCCHILIMLVSTASKCFLIYQRNDLPHRLRYERIPPCTHTAALFALTQKIWGHACQVPDFPRNSKFLVQLTTFQQIHLIYCRFCLVKHRCNEDMDIPSIKCSTLNFRVPTSLELSQIICASSCMLHTQLRATHHAENPGA